MAKYEKTRKYVVASIIKNVVTMVAPKGRSYDSKRVHITRLPARTVKTLKVGAKVTLYRFSNPFTTYFAPKA